MDFDFLPDDLKNIIHANEDDCEIVCVIRGSGSFNGKSGESYAVATSGNLYLFERPFGRHEHSGERGAFADLDSISLEKSKFSSTLNINFNPDRYIMKISPLELGCAEELLSHASALDVKIETRDLDQPGPAISPAAAFAAALTFAATVDEELSEAEDNYIKRVCPDDKSFNAGVTYYEDHSFEELLEELKLDDQQKLCFLSNILEICMSDGILSKNECQLIDRFVKVMGISEADSLNLRNALLIKNQLSVLE